MHIAHQLQKVTTQEFSKSIFSHILIRNTVIPTQEISWSPLSHLTLKSQLGLLLC